MFTQRGLAPIVIVLLIAAAIGGYLVYQNQIKVIPQVQQTAQPSPTPLDETANWKKYTNTKYSYSLEYPSNHHSLDAELMPQTINGDEFMVSFLKYSSEEAQKYKSDNREMVFYDYTGIVVQEGSCSKLALQGNSVTIDGVVAMKYVGSSSTFADPQYGDILVLIDKDNYCYHLAFLRDPDKLKLSEEIFNQILSTFKFTD